MILSQVEERKQHLDPQNPTGVVDMWLIEQSKADSSSEPFLSRIDILVSSIMDLYFAGIETTSMTINWATKYLAKYPDMQDRIYAEIVKQVRASVVPPSALIHEGLPGWQVPLCLTRCPVLFSLVKHLLT